MPNSCTVPSPNFFKFFFGYFWIFFWNFLEFLSQKKSKKMLWLVLCLSCLLLVALALHALPHFREGGGDFVPRQVRGGIFRCGKFGGDPWFFCGKFCGNLQKYFGVWGFCGLGVREILQRPLDFA